MGRKRKYWYGVKSLYREEAVGEPAGADADYDPEATLVEERVVLFRARSDKKAIAKGRREADRYAADPAGSFTNPYGQRVVTRRIKVLQIWPIMWSLRDGCEVWSDTETLPASMSDQEIEDRRFGSETDDRLRLRKKFIGRGWPDPQVP